VATLDRGGVKLSHEEAGSGTPAMVFVHGWTCDRSYFAPQCEHFRESHRVIALDLRGHGDSDAPEGDYSMSVLADDVAWLCTQLGVTGAVVVGHSMGAIVGIELTARHPQLVSALVLVEPGPIAPPPELAALLSGFVEAMSGPDPEAVRRDFVSKSLFLPSDDPVLKERVLVEMLAAPNHVALECFRGMATWPGETVIKAVGVPVLAVHADTSINEPERLAALCQLLRMPRRPEWVTSTTCSPRRRSTGSSNSSSARQLLVWPGTPVVTGGSPAEVLRCRVSFRRR